MAFVVEGVFFSPHSNIKLPDHDDVKLPFEENYMKDFNKVSHVTFSKWKFY